LAQQRASAKGQYPAAVLLTCIDSRAPAETILDLRIGDIFNSRVAGNVENADILAVWSSLQLVGSPQGVLVMAIRRVALSRARRQHPTWHLTSLLKNKTRGAATTYTGDRTSKNYALSMPSRARMVETR